jgi:hypothetical protein
MAALSRAEINRLADSIHFLLDDPDARLTRDARLRWEGALTALEAVLGVRPRLSPDTFDVSPL